MSNIVISKNIESKVITNQGNKCAKKPYSRITGLNKHNCVLWKNKGTGKFVDKQYVLIKKNYNGDVNAENLIALCPECFKILMNRTQKKVKHAEEIDSDDELLKKFKDENELIMKKPELKECIIELPLQDKIIDIKNQGNNKEIIPKNTKECCVCLEDIEEKYVLIPCGHTSICKNCIPKIKECSICITKIINHIKIYD
jgi:hypothetical protein